jgi:hypothetical protein
LNRRGAQKFHPAWTRLIPSSSDSKRFVLASAVS